MGISANQARQILLDSRKMDLEYQMQNVSNERLMLAKKSSSMLADMLNLVVPTPPSTTDFMETVYSFTSDGENFNLLNWEQSNGEDGYGYNVTISRPVSETVYTASTGKSTPTLSRSVAASSTGSTDITEALKTYTYPVVSGAVANKTTDAVASFLPDLNKNTNTIQNAINKKDENIIVNQLSSYTDVEISNCKTDEFGKMSFTAKHNNSSSVDFRELTDEEYLQYYYNFADTLNKSGNNYRLFATTDGEGNITNVACIYTKNLKNGTGINLNSMCQSKDSEIGDVSSPNELKATNFITEVTTKTGSPGQTGSGSGNCANGLIFNNSGGTDRTITLGQINGFDLKGINIGAIASGSNTGKDSSFTQESFTQESLMQGLSSSAKINDYVFLIDEQNKKIYRFNTTNESNITALTNSNFINASYDVLSYADDSTKDIGGAKATKLDNVPDNVSQAAGEGNDVYSIKLPSGDVYVTVNGDGSFNMLSNSSNSFTINGESVEKMNEEALENTLGQDNYNLDKNSYYQNNETGEIWEYNYSSGKWNMYAPEVEYKFNGQEAEKVENWENISGIDQTILNNKGLYDCYIINGQYTFIPKKIFDNAQLQDGSSSSGSTASNVTTYEQKDSMFINTDQLFELSSDQLKELPSNISFDSSTQSIYAVYENNDPSSGTITKYIVMAKGAETGKETNTTTYERKTTYPGGDTTFTAKANIIFEQDGQIPYIDIEGMGTFMLTSSQVQDTEAYDAAMEAYNFDKEEYDRTVSEINTETARLENLDKAFEIQMDQLNTEYKAVSAELDSIEQLLSKNIEKGFKYGQ